MIYHNECKRCTNQWESCCYGYIANEEFIIAAMKKEDEDGGL